MWLHLAISAFLEIGLVFGCSTAQYHDQGSKQFLLLLEFFTNIFQVVNTRNTNLKQDLMPQKLMVLELIYVPEKKVKCVDGVLLINFAEIKMWDLVTMVWIIGNHRKTHQKQFIWIPVAFVMQPVTDFR